ncbi:YicC/YloC family endoribonuclease [Mesonia sp. MT50]|uniref:YicC/YloC family endoribonuclease n=1 Tax=Mesonia profundi TaxID=3070998 RepID=A0ABU0ZXG8_9FLAO|nr:YicC/YloC family endoribonuclease [Mesonia profundi]MDQ7916159.1 YicC/YloC family endoribonuclease [Mesonia profundi]
MIQSMTGFGKHTVELPNKKITIEIKTLNSKNLDLNARMPSQYREKELSLRNKISKSLQRGKVDFSLYAEVTGEETSSAINAVVVKNYMAQLKAIPETGNKDDVELLKMAIRLPDALKTEREEVDEDEFIAIEKGVEAALQEVTRYRLDEGKALEQDFVLRITNIKNILSEIIAIDPQRVEAVKERLRKGIADLKENVDENRFEQELVYYIEKYDITEEKIRLDNHLSYFTESLNSSDSNGKKLGFIGQEIGREVNTIGSKSNYAPMQKLVVEMKDELEKIKEQLLNVL